MARVIGIDLGTTNCAVSCINTRGDAEILQNTNGENITPSVVQFDGDDIIVGKEAKNSALALPEETISFVKRCMDNPTSLGFKYEGKEYSAIDISAIILKKLKEDSEKKLNDSITQAVITVPAYFDNVAKEATKQAAEIAGLEVLRLIMEPSAAAIYYSHMNDHKLDNKRILVYDLGGGTFDVSVVDLSNGDINVVSTEGDAKLGGKDFDERIIALLKDKISKQFPDDVDWDDIDIKTELYEKAEDIKKSLSSKESVKLKFSFAKKFRDEITRQELKECVDTLISNSLNIMNMAIKEALEKDAKNIDEVVLVGGSTKMPLVAEAIEAELGIKPLSNVNPDEVVAQGAALLATQISIQDKPNSEEAKVLPQNVQNSINSINVSDIVPHSLGVIVNHSNQSINKIMVKHGESIPHTSIALTGYGLSPFQSEANLQVTQGESDEVDLVEVIAESTLSRPSSFPNDQFCNMELTYSYDANGLIKAYGNVEGQNFELEVKSQYTLSSNELNQKKNELEQADVE